MGFPLLLYYYNTTRKDGARLTTRLLYMAGSVLYFMPLVYGFWVYGIYIAVFLIILTLYILGKRRKTEVREIDLYTPSLALQKGGR